MDDNLENFNLALRTQKTNNESSRRQIIMQELLNELLVINDAIEREKTHPFSSLEVIIEEVTPCSSSQQLENNLSAIKAEMRTHAQDQDLEQESAIDSSEEFDISDEFVSNKNSLKDMFHTNMLFIKERAQLINNEGYNSDVSTTSTKIESTFNDSNTSNTDRRNGDSCNISDSAESTGNKRKCIECKYDSVTSEDESVKVADSKRNYEIANFENTDSKEEMYRKYDRFINNDDRYIKKDNSRNKFATLNKNYERCRHNLNRNRYSSTSNLDKFSEKENKSPYAWAIREPVKPEIIKPNSDKKYCGDISFACLNTYSVKTNLNNKPSTGKIDYNNCTVEELEERLKFFEDQVQNIKEAFGDNAQLDESYKYEPENQVSSPEDVAHKCDIWRAECNNSFNLDRGDYKSIDNCSNLIDKMPIKMGHIDSSPNDSQESFKENKSSDNNYSERSLGDNEGNYSGTLIVVKQPSKETCDSGRYTRSSRNKPNYEDENDDENDDDNDYPIQEDTQQTYPKIMYPSVTKHVSTQVTDSDWQKICYVKKEMAEAGFLRLNLPNSSDDEILDDSRNETGRTRTKVLFKSETAIINDSNTESSTDKDITPAFTPITVEENVPEELTGCGCSWINNLKKIFIRK